MYLFLSSENLAKNKGWDGAEQLGMGKLYPPENIMRRWVDLEEFWGYPANAHLTQSLWRASRYLGCGDSYRDYPDGQVCRVQVCRYVRAGNCAMNSFQAKSGDNWLKPMLMGKSYCCLGKFILHLDVLVCAYNCCIFILLSHQNRRFSVWTNDSSTRFRAATNMI